MEEYLDPLQEKKLKKTKNSTPLGVGKVVQLRPVSALLGWPVRKAYSRRIESGT